MDISKITWERHLKDYGLIIIGALLQAVSYVIFVSPYKIVPGGIYGISIVLHHISKGMFTLFPDGLPIGAVALCFNIPLVILAIKKLGVGSGQKTVVTFLLVSFFTDTLYSFVGNTCLVENDPFIASFYGGAILGLGVTCIFKAQSTSAGTDVLARIMANASGQKVGTMIILFDGMVVLLGLVAFQDWSVPLYSWFTIFVFGKVVEMFQTENPNRAVFIVSKKNKEISDMLLTKLHMGGTYLHGKGMYKGEEEDIIFTIAERKDLLKLKDEVKEIDPNAFLSTMHASKEAPAPRR